MSEAAENAWALVQEQLQRRLPPQQFRTWFENLRADEPAPGGPLVVRVPNQFFCEWINRNYLNLLREVTAEVAPGAGGVEVLVDAGLAQQQQEEETPETVSEDVPVRAAIDGMPLNPYYVFDQFVTGPSNRLAHAAAKAVADNPGSVYNPLYMHGPVGLGKSHLLQAICHDFLRRKPPLRVIYLSCESFVNQFISAIQGGSLDQFRERCRHADALLIDDIQFLARAERTQEEFFHTFNALHNAQRQIVLSSDSEPTEIAIEARLTSRFASGLVARLDPPSLETRMAIIRRKAELRGLELGDDVVAFVAERFTANIRELEGALVKLMGYSSLTRRPLDLDLAREALAEPLRTQAPTTMQDILDAVAGHYRVRIADLQSKKRTRSVVTPRQICMYLARKMTNLSLEEIGGYFGGRDHSTVLHAEQKIRDQLAADRAMQETFDKLKRDIVKSR